MSKVLENHKHNFDAALLSGGKSIKATMFHNIGAYLNAVQRAWHAQDGQLLANFVSLSDKHINSRVLHVEMPDNQVERIVQQPMDEIVCAHLKVLYYLTRQRECFLCNLYVFHSLTFNCI